MDVQRIGREVTQARTNFAYVEVHPTTNGAIYVKAALQTSAGRTYVIAIHFAEYPSRMPTVFITIPALRDDAPHRYKSGNVCYLHPSMWNPGRHNVAFVLWRAAKWLNKYEVWRQTGRWPGAQLEH